MKRILPIITLILATVLGVWAQTNPNRLLVVDKTGNYSGYLVERVDSLMFVQIEGRVAADVEFFDFWTGETGDTIVMSIQMTEKCWSYKIDLIPNNYMAWLSDEATLANYIDQNTSARYYNSFEQAEMTGMEDLTPDADYTIATVGFDMYGIACSTSTATFHTPKPEVVGDPTVEYDIIDVTSDSFTINFKPNADVSSYSCCSFKKGEMQSQFEMFGAWMGFASISEMVYAWGIPQTGDYTQVWKQMNPGTEYEVGVAVKDINGNFGDLIIVPVTTLSLGGDGVSEITIELGDYINSPTDGFMQQVIFTPNAETAVYHTLIIEKGAFDEDWSEEAVDEYLLSDVNPYNPWDTYWDIYGVDDYYWMLDPATEYYAFAWGKNALGEWGKKATEEFTSASIEAPTAKKATKQAKRVVKVTTSGTARPVFPINNNIRKASTGITLK